MHALLRGTATLAAAGVAGVGYASLVERNWFALRRRSAPVLPRDATPLRILHLTDLHLMPGQRRKVEWVRGLAALAPDLVVNTGDNIAHEGSVDVLARAFEPLFDVPGVFVFGSNDYFKPRVKNPFRYFLQDDDKRFADGARLPTERLARTLTAGGWTDLTNTREQLSVAGMPLEFVGVDDPHLSYDRYDLVAAPADPAAALTVGVTHAPYQRTLDAMTSDGAALVIAGHTHGGQVCLPLVGALVTNCDLDRKRAKGISRWWPGAGAAGPTAVPADAAYLEVSAGLGTSPMAPVRFACRPEATLLTLTPRVG
ncbi:MAG: metallophosphoesterase [Dermatophilaceae bacterium]